MMMMMIIITVQYDSGGDMVMVMMVMITISMMLIMHTSSHTVRTGVGLVTSSSEVNSSHALMTLDNSLSTCFMSKDVSQY